MDYDVIIIGGGHNGLVTGAYLAEAGYRVAVFERRRAVGGTAITEDVVPDFRFDFGGSAQMLTRLSPVAEELHLEKHGLEYIDLDPLFFAPFPDDDHFFIHRDVDSTADQLEWKYPGEGDAYSHFVSDWLPFARNLRNALLSAPSPLELGKKFVVGAKSDIPWRTTLQRVLRPYGDVVGDYFHEPKVRAAMVWLAAQAGPPPMEPVTGGCLLWHPLYHEHGLARPRGGMGMLTDALSRHLASHGGEIHLDAPASSIVCKEGRTAGIRVHGKTYTARAVVSATHAVETFDRLIPEHLRPPGRVNMRIGNGCGVMLRVALRAPVRYRSYDGDAPRRGLQLLCRDERQIEIAYGDLLRGQPAGDPPLVAMTFSATDHSLAPEGHEALWLWGQYYPHQLSGRVAWDDMERAVAGRMLDTFERYAPGTRENVMGYHLQHPDWLEREFGLYGGNRMHLEMSVDQMFGFRPFMGMARYYTHIRGLYITGASTHPGGIVMGAAGRNAARVVLKDLEKRRV